LQGGEEQSVFPSGKAVGHEQRFGPADREAEAIFERRIEESTDASQF
jgi:hypothetical protein